MEKLTPIIVEDKDIEELTWLICTCANKEDNILPIQGLVCEAYRSKWCYICYEYYLRNGISAPRWCRLEWDFYHYIIKTMKVEPKELTTETILKLFEEFKRQH